LLYTPAQASLHKSYTACGMDYVGRQKSLRRALPKHHLDALLITHLPNIRYLCGFTGSAAVLLLSEDRTVFFTDGRYTSQARDEVQEARVITQQRPPLVVAAEWLSSHVQAARIGFDPEHLSVAAQGRLRKHLVSNVRLVWAPALIEQLRSVKDQQEIGRIRDAVILASGLFRTVLDAIKPGEKELSVAAEVEYAASCAGAAGMSFPTLIAAGRRSALPHGRPSTARLPRRGFVVCDFGVILDGYCSDMTRTIHLGRPTAEARHAYHAVLEAQQLAISAVQPGRSVGEVDQAARNSLQKAKLGRYFTHSTGHGVGLEIHEAPRLAMGQKEVLQPGMVVTVEPGIYIPEKFGVRIEDMVVVNERGCEVITPTSKELISV
jgi:Xaa-Pro aminopeptidase